MQNLVQFNTERSSRFTDEATYSYKSLHNTVILYSYISTKRYILVWLSEVTIKATKCCGTIDKL